MPLVMLYTSTLSYDANNLLWNCWWIMWRQWHNHHVLLKFESWTQIYIRVGRLFDICGVQHTIYNGFRMFREQLLLLILLFKMRSLLLDCYNMHALKLLQVLHLTFHNLIPTMWHRKLCGSVRSGFWTALKGKVETWTFTQRSKIHTKALSASGFWCVSVLV